MKINHPWLSLVLLSFFGYNQAIWAQMAKDYRHERPLSFSARQIKFSLRLIGLKHWAGKDPQQGRSKSQAAKLPRKLRRRQTVTVWAHEGRKVWQIAPKAEHTDKTLIVYLHGGAYIHNIMGLHWKGIERMQRARPCLWLVPDYPLAPQAKAEQVHAFMRSFYARILAEYPGYRLVFMGDSAGGGLALAFTQTLLAEGQHLPAQLVLLSPWLDLEMANPGIEPLRRKDPMLNLKGLRLAAKAYAGAWPLLDARISPLYGANQENLPPTALFIGGHDLLWPDAKRYRDQARVRGQDLTFFEYPRLFHVWMLAPNLPEAKQVEAQIRQIIWPN